MAKFTKVFLIFVLLIELLFVYYCYFSPNSPRNKMAKNLHEAEEHVPIVMKVLGNDERFENVRVFPYTGDGGCLGVFGEVKTEFELNELVKIIENSKPPVRVYWEVKINPVDKEI